ncbi:P63C domain-containing protein [Adhaeribacter soli]|uniref:Bacteriophage Mx8 p63 C-terminal domain-containing protein n=1 Tax=Adhaeribacter soli TaxID=2607655 RepID=A0A5N1IXJ1_9BACT|nr:P63C domain-containing protein [Adhaeribacter soli]KAA9338808.1 hypothetical protein F0P94_08410 [Adhaeribacter soli]
MKLENLEEKNPLEPQKNNEVFDDVQAFLNLVTRQADKDSRAKYEKKKEKEKFERINGEITSIHEIRERNEKLLSEFPLDHEPKFSLFFPALGRLENWSEDVQKCYQKPPIAAKTINEVIYSRFKEDVISHIHSKNPYIKYCIRKYKNYRFLGEDGILKLEKYIDDAVTLMNECTSTYEFRIKHATRFGTGFQPDLFK